MQILNAGILGLLSYGLTSALLYGGPVQALSLLTFWRDRLGLAFWPALIPVALLLAVFAAKFLAWLDVPRVILPAVFVAISMGLSTLLVGMYAETRRSSVVEAFEPDIEIRSSILESFRNAPRDFQLFLHGAALKDCIPYAWSYRQMAFYELPSNVAVNVLPRSWIEACNIQRIP